MSKADKEATPLNVMLGNGCNFEVVVGEGEKEQKKLHYKVMPLKLREVDEFMEDQISIGSQLFNMASKERQEKVDKWLSRKVKTEKGEPLTLEMALEQDWSLDDLRNCLLKLADISG